MIASGGGGDASSFVSLPFFYLAAVVLEVRVIGRQVPVVVDADHKGISLMAISALCPYLSSTSSAGFSGYLGEGR